MNKLCLASAFGSIEISNLVFAFTVGRLILKLPFNLDPRLIAKSEVSEVLFVGDVFSIGRCTGRGYEIRAVCPFSSLKLIPRAPGHLFFSPFNV